MRRAIVFAALTLTAGCDWFTSPNRTVRASSPAEVSLGVGREALVDGTVWVRFDGVPADSRCPANADCVWAGDAAVALTVVAGSNPSAADTIHTTLDPKSAFRGGYTIALVQLTPYPEAPGPIKPGDYVVRLSIAAGPSPL